METTLQVWVRDEAAPLAPTAPRLADLVLRGTRGLSVVAPVGPRPYLTHVYSDGEHWRVCTVVLQWQAEPSSAQIDAVRARVVDVIRLDFPSLPNAYVRTLALPYDAARDGPLSEWRSGAIAARARHPLDWPSALAAPDPVFPGEAPPSSLRSEAAGTFGAIASTIRALVPLAVVAGAVYLAKSIGIEPQQAARSIARRRRK